LNEGGHDGSINPAITLDRLLTQAQMFFLGNASISTGGIAHQIGEITRVVSKYTKRTVLPVVGGVKRQSAKYAAKSHAFLTREIELTAQDINGIADFVSSAYHATRERYQDYAFVERLNYWQIRQTTERSLRKMGYEIKGDEILFKGNTVGSFDSWYKFHATVDFSHFAAAEKMRHCGFFVGYPPTK